MRLEVLSISGIHHGHHSLALTATTLYYNILRGQEAWGIVNRSPATSADVVGRRVREPLTGDELLRFYSDGYLRLGRVIDDDTSIG